TELYDSQLLPTAIDWSNIPTNALGFLPRMGQRVVATGGAQRNPWKHRNPVAPEGRRNVRLPLRGSSNRFDCRVPRVPLRSTRGYTPRPLRGQERSPPGTAVRLLQTGRQVLFGNRMTRCVGPRRL